MAGLYFHIPFCEHKCIYCDFYSIEDQRSIPEFTESLKSEITLYARAYAEKEIIETVYWGGGTPSLLDGRTVHHLMNHLNREFRLSANAEVTLETNPGTVDRQKLAAFRNAGINRLSLGVQSFFDEDLRFLTRIHSSAQALEAFAAARDTGFDNISLDLISSLPYQTLDRWRNNLEKALALYPEHLSTYALIVEEGTPLHEMIGSGDIEAPDEELAARMIEVTMDVLEHAGLHQYEISNFSKPGWECRHNLSYWNHSNYLGFGPSAHSFWKDDEQSGKRWWNVRNTGAYVISLSNNKVPVEGGEHVGTLVMMNESIMLELRMGRLDLNEIRNTYHSDIEKQHHDLLTRFQSEGYLTLKDGTLLLSKKGFLYNDTIAESLIASS